MKICSVENCNINVRSTNSDLCEKHYMRMYRRGSLDDRVVKHKTISSNGYILIKNDNIPVHIRHKSGYAYEHRVVFFNNYGEGPYNCHWCGVSLNFEDICIDHLNEIKTDNRIENIVCSCNPCNSGRTAKKCRDAIIRKQGYMITHNQQTMCLEDWARKIGITSTGLKWRIDRGWDLEKALSKKSKKKSCKIRGSEKIYTPFVLK